MKRKFLGIDIEEEFLEISKSRRLEIETEKIFKKYRNKLQGFNKPEQLVLHLSSEPSVEYKTEIDLTITPNNK